MGLVVERLGTLQSLGRGSKRGNMSTEKKVKMKREESRVKEDMVSNKKWSV